MEVEETFKARGLGQSFDWWLVGIYLVLVTFGLVNIYASIHSSDPSSIFDWSVRSGKQAVWILTSLGLAAFILFVLPSRMWEGGSIPLYVIVLFLLVAVIFLGTEVKGSKSWFSFGAVKFQPAEISKITTSLLLSYVLSRPGFKMMNWKWFMLAGLVIAVPMLVIVAESETGSALVYVGFIFVLYREGLSGWLLGGIGTAILIFVLTLTASPYTSILVSIAIITLANAIYSGRLWRWLLVYGTLIILMAFLPMGYEALLDYLIPGHTLLADENLDPALSQAIVEASRWSFLLKIKPAFILIILSLALFPIYIMKSYRDKNLFLILSLGAYLLCVGLTFSTSYIFNNVLAEHQRLRIEVLLGLKEDPAGVGYNVNQSMIAIGSGGLYGKGFLNGTQTTYGFVPEQSTDFIFCTVGEEWGFLGCAFVIFLYVALIWKIMADAERCREHFTRIYGYCVAACLFMHLFINIGMTIGIMPVIGIPLPLMSYGGSSLWAFTVLIFIFVALYHEERKYF